MVEGSDLYGDGVNIAARLEVLAEPGSVYVFPRNAEPVDPAIRTSHMCHRMVECEL